MNETTVPQRNNPLQLGQTLYEVLDATVVAIPKGGSGAVYHRVLVNSKGSTVEEHCDLGEYDDIIDVKAVADAIAGTQPIFVLSKSGLTRLGSDKGIPVETRWTFDTSALVSIVDLNPEKLAHSVLLLAGQDNTGPFILPFDCALGSPAARIRIPSSSGRIVAGQLVRRQLDAHLVLIAIRDGTLAIDDLGNEVLRQGQFTGTPTSATVGPIQSGGTVSSLAASMLSGTSDQQIALAYPDQNGACTVAVFAFDQDTLARYATLAPDVTFAPPDRPVFRLAAGDLLANGVDQLVLGYAGTYATVRGCAALFLMELDPGDHPSLSVLSKYVCANFDADETHQPFASIDLHLAAGLFGESLPAAGGAGATPGVLGILLVGAGATMKQLFSGEASIMTGLVTVDAAQKSLPPFPSGAPATPALLSSVVTIDADCESIWALPSDVTGMSVVLGTPTLSQALGKSQILAIVLAPPYEAGVSSSKPSLTFAQSKNQVQGYAVSSNKMWMFSKDVGLNLGIGGLTLGRSINKNYGNGFDKIDDNSTNTLVQVSTTITDDDLLVLYGMGYYVWTYPVYRKAAQELPDGNMVVLFPMSPSPVQTVMPLNAKTCGYRQQSQNGSLLTYLNVPHDGYADENCLFDEESFPVTQDSGGTTVIFDQTKMVSSNVGKSYTVHNSTTDSAHFMISKTLFDFLPVSFGLNLSSGEMYSENDMETTTLSHTTTMSITISSGSTKDVGYDYQILPQIYQHDTLGCLMVGFDIELLGSSWSQYFRTPSIILVAPYVTSSDGMLAGYSRSIEFADTSDGRVEIRVTLFNNSLMAAKQVTCEFYRGAPALNGTKRTPQGDAFAVRSLDTLGPAARGSVAVDAELEAGDQITVKVYSDDLGILGKVYWGLYPASAFAEWSG